MNVVMERPALLILFPETFNMSLSVGCMNGKHKLFSEVLIVLL